MKNSCRILVLLLVFVFLTGCAGGVVEAPPGNEESSFASSGVVSESTDAVSSQEASSSQTTTSTPSASSSTVETPTSKPPVTSSAVSSSVSSKPSTQPTAPPEEPTPDDSVRHWVQWTGGPARPNGTNSFWDWKTAARVKVNQLSVYYLATDNKGETVYGVPTVDQCAAMMKTAAYELGESKKAGVDIIGYSDTVQISRKSASDMGYSLNQLCAVDSSGNFVFTRAWHADGLYICCVNSPQWREWLKENVRLHAEAGFAGIQFDFHPYAAAGLFCRCDNCRESWDAYCMEAFGEKKAFLQSLNFDYEDSRAYYWWKMECFADFMKEVGSEAKKINPDFKMMMNNNVNGYNYAFEALLGAWDVPTSEHHGSNNGYSSTMYMYQMSEGLGYNDLHSQYNTWDEVSPIFRYKTNLAESAATIGGISYVTDQTGWGKKMFAYVAEHPEIYSESKSISNVAVLYSAESNLFSLKSNQLNLSSLLFSFSTDRARQASSALVKAGFSSDYLVVERDDAKDLIDQYSAFVVPEYTYYNDATWAPLIKEMEKQGKKIIVLGRESKAFFNKKISSSYENITYVPAFTGVASEEALQLSSQFQSAVHGISDLYSLNNFNDSALTIREYGSKTYIHVVRRGADESDRSTHYQSLRWKIPEGKTISSVTAECPFTSKSVSLDWTVYNGFLEIVSEDFDTYLVITIS